MMVVIGKGDVTSRFDSRAAMISSAVELFRERGYSGTGFRDVIAHSGAPRGSIYHHFPGGKAQLAEESMRHAGDEVAVRLERSIAEHGIVEALRRYVRWWRRTLEASDFRSGCPVVAVAIEAHESAGPADAADATLARWEAVFADGMRREGVEDARACSLATLTVAALEGAVVRCRAARSTAPLEAVAAELEALIATAAR
jgi:AcrR family transcriptional regulator